MTSCPSDEQLSQLAYGRLKGEPLATLERHVDGCSSCRQLLAVISNGSAPPTQPERGVLQTGESLGRYEIERLLAAGGMGMLYVARDTQLKRRVALKLMRPAFGGDVGRVRLLREAQAMAALTHPNVIGVYELGEVDGRVFVAMEFVEGGTLREWMKSPSTWRDVVLMFVAAGKGLAAAHDVGIVHRDFKPENVLVSRDGIPRIADFGLSRPEVVAMEEPPRNLPMKITQTGTLLGTPAYMSPEQLAGRAADARSDQYSFCVCLYEALAGKRPFPADTLEELRARVTGGMPPPPKDGLVPAHVWAAIARGLHPDPLQRFPDMGALLTVLAFPAVNAPSWRASRVRGVAGRVSAAVLALAVVGGGAAAFVAAERERAAVLVVAPPPALPRPAPLQPLPAPEVPKVTGEPISIVMSVGERSRIGFAAGIERVTVSDAAIAQVRGDAEGHLDILAQAPGATTAMVWNREGRREVKIEVNPAEPEEKEEETQIPEPQAKVPQITIGLGGNRVLTVPNLQRIAISDDSICDVTTIGNNQIMLKAEHVGTTTLLLWKAGGARESYTVHVTGKKPAK